MMSAREWLVLTILTLADGFMLIHIGSNVLTTTNLIGMAVTNIGVALAVIATFAFFIFGYGAALWEESRGEKIEQNRKGKEG